MKKIVYILSTNYAGSHLLSLCIAGHSRFQHIGEAKGLRYNKHPDRQRCGICNGHENCPVLRGITPNNIDNIYDIVFSNIGPGVHGLVDNSKKPFWAQRFLSDKRYEKKMVFLVRDPRALMRRWLIDEKLNLFHERLKLLKYPPRYLKKSILGDPVDIYLGKWLQQNWKIQNFISKYNLDSFLLTYHDLVINEAEVLPDLMNWLGERYEPGQEKYWNFTHHGSTKPEYRETKDIQLDCRWKDYLEQEQQDRITSDHYIRAFIKQCGMTMNDDGLTLFA